MGRSSFLRSLALSALVTLGLACATQVVPWYEVDPGEGKLLLIRQFAEKSGERRALEVHTRAGTQIADVDGPLAARWLDPETLLVLVDGGSSEPGLVRYDLRSRSVTPLPFGNGAYDVEPSLAGDRLAWGRGEGAAGAGRLETRSLVDSRLLGRRRAALESPRWRPDGQELVAGLAVGALQVHGSFPPSSAPPRLHVLSADLERMTFIEDSDQPGRLQAGGSRPLWWDARGIWARQERGLVRCDPTGGCQLVYEPGADRQVVAGRPIGDGEALLLTVTRENAAQGRAPNGIHRVDLATGEGHPAYLLEPGESFTDIDWIAVPTPTGN